MTVWIETALLIKQIAASGIAIFIFKELIELASKQDSKGRDYLLLKESLLLFLMQTPQKNWLYLTIPYFKNPKLSCSNPMGTFK
jgi:hypothetical protein